MLSNKKPEGDSFQVQFNNKGIAIATLIHSYVYLLSSAKAILQVV